VVRQTWTDILAACDSAGAIVSLGMFSYAQGMIVLIGSGAIWAMGLQNALAREIFPALPATTGMTGNAVISTYTMLRMQLKT